VNLKFKPIIAAAQYLTDKVLLSRKLFFDPFKLSSVREFNKAFKQGLQPSRRLFGFSESEV